MKWYVVDKNYIKYLFQKEKAIIDRMQPIIQRKAEKLYAKCLRIPESSLTASFD